MKKINKRFDLFITFILLVIAAAGWLFLNLNPLIGGALFTLFPSVYLIKREKKNILKIFLATVIFGGLFGFVFYFIETLNKAWSIGRLVIPWKILGVLPIDDLLTFFLMTFFVVVFYEHFIDDEKNKRISKNIIWALTPSILATIAVVLLFLFTNKRFFMISYAYLIGGIAAITPPIVLSFYKPRLLSKLLSTAASFCIILFIAEIVALKTGGWVFLGEYIGKVSVFGITFPLEELFFWIILYAASIVSYYEFFVDDMR